MKKDFNILQGVYGNLFTGWVRPSGWGGSTFLSREIVVQGEQICRVSGSAAWVQVRVFSTCYLHERRHVTKILFYKWGIWGWTRVEALSKIRPMRAGVKCGALHLRGGHSPSAMHFVLVSIWEPEGTFKTRQIMSQPLFQTLQRLPISFTVKHKPHKGLQSPTLSGPCYYLTVSLTHMLSVHFPDIRLNSFLFFKHTLASRPSYLL